MTHATGPQIFREGEFIIVEFEGEFGGLTHGQSFIFEGRLYVFGPQWEGDTRGVWRVKDPSAGWILARGIRFVQWEPATITEQLQLPDSVAGRPTSVLPLLSGSVMNAFSFHSDGFRLVRTVAFLAFEDDDARVEIPLIDADGRPWIAPEVPPMMVVRRHKSTTDHVSNPSANDVGWSDQGCSFRPGVATMTTGLGQGLVHAYLKQAADPVPHWVLRITFYGDGATGGDEINVLVDLLGQGYGPHASSSRENGSSGTVGHWKTNLVWTQQGFNATPNHTAFSERSFAIHAVDVANNPDLTTPTTTWLTSNSLSTGTEQFGELPMCDVVADATNGTFNTATETTWENETWGLGVIDVRTGISTSIKMYDTTVSFDSVASRFKVIIRNASGRVATVAPADDTTKDRSFRIYSVGKRA